MISTSWPNYGSHGSTPSAWSRTEPAPSTSLAALTDLAAERGIATCVEPVVGLSIADLPSALAAVEYVDRDEISLLIDTMHVARFGATADDLRSVPAERIGYIQSERYHAAAQDEDLRRGSHVRTDGAR